jgi:hypothetical protein
LTPYSGPISVSSSTAIQAIAIAPNTTVSASAQASYVITPTSTGPVIPPNAIMSSSVQQLDEWHFNHDPATPGTADGESQLVNTPSLSGNARQFVSSYTGAGGEIYSVSYANDTTSMNFVYDAWVYLEAGSSLANLEMDSNQVIANGDTVIFAFQCDGYSKTWDFGGPWLHSTQYCDVNTWTQETWHHVQISYSRDGSGNANYHSVWLDGVEQVINGTQFSSHALGWKIGDINTQFQIDGLGASGGSTLYADNLTIYRW